MEVVDEQKHRCRARHAIQERHHRIEEPVTLDLGLGADRFGELRYSRRHVGREADQLSTERPDLVGQLARRSAGDIPPQRLRERLIGQGQFLVTASVEHDAGGLVDDCGEDTGEARLADPGLAPDDHDLAMAVAGQPPRRRQTFQGMVAPNENGVRRRQDPRRHTRFAVSIPGRRRRWFEVEHRILLDDGSLQSAQLSPGFDSELFDQRVACALVRTQRVGLTPGPVHRQHQLAPGTLAQGIGADDRLQLSDTALVTTQCELSIHAILGQDRSQLVESSRFGSCERLIGELDQRGTPPTGQGPLEYLDRAPMVS